MAIPIQKRMIPTKISPDILDTIGKSFKFKHGKGVAEWLKNSLDHYLRLKARGEETLNGNWPVLLCLIDAPSQTKGPNLAVIDFGGTEYQEIKDFFLHWGDRSAATHGGKVTHVSLTGGHGNGGKFYMREMWRKGARFITWKRGKATSLIVNKEKKGSTGYFELEDVFWEWQKALEFALNEEEGLGGHETIVDYIKQAYPQIYEEIEQQRRGFSVVVGRCAVQLHSSNDVVVGGKWKHQKLIDHIREARQARRPLRELCVSVLINGKVAIERLALPEVEPDPHWPPMHLEIPGALLQANTSIGKLKIIKSALQLKGRFSDFNAVTVLDKHGNPIGYYPLHSLPIPGYSTLLSFISAEAQLTFSSVEEYVTNDREHLITSPTTERIINWIAKQIWEVVKKIEQAESQKRHLLNLKQASKLNRKLNFHIQKFLERLETEIMVDFIPSVEKEGIGNKNIDKTASRASGPSEGKRNAGKRGGQGEGGTLEKLSSSGKKVRRPRYPQLLLSGIDADPSNKEGKTKILTDRHPPLYQDEIDRTFNVWWLNTQHPFAAKALEKGGADGPAFRSHQLSMFRDMVQREALRILQRREAELPLDRIETELDEISNRFLAELPWEIVEEILNIKTK